MENINANILLMGLFLASLVIFGTVFAAFYVARGPQDKIRKRLKHLKGRYSDKATISTSSDSILLNQDGSALDQLVKSLLPRPMELKNRLARAGLNIGVGAYAAIGIGLALVSYILLSVIVGVPVILSLLLALAGGVGLPHLIISRRINSRIQKFIALFPDAIDLIVRGLRSGLPVSESINAVSTEIGAPVGEEFQKIADAMRFGTSMEDAMWDATRRVDTADFKFFVICLAVQKETGGNLAETLTNLSDILRRRQQMKLKIRAMSAEGRASAMIVGLLPFIMFGLLLSINYDYASILFTDPRAIIISVGGLIWMGLGALVMAKMISFEI